ncbi:MAG: hypothetical protein GX157_00535 [Candidatus Cloacimonetes bacterium]|nr:hypothetical protein [Candidatus Cloacimonadota bacterium]
MLIHTPSDIYFKRAGGTRVQERARGARYASQTELINLERAGGTRVQERARGARYTSQTELINLERAGGRRFRLEQCKTARNDPLGRQNVL